MKVLVVLGTRPEAIKLAPIIRILREDPKHFELRVCVTGQHREMLDQVLGFFEIVPEFDLNLMRPNQTLYDITADGLRGLRDVLLGFGPDNVIVQGDATSSFVGALAGFYGRARISHVEAGLRSGDKEAPYPEEVNRTLISHMADYHFAPTERARANLAAEGLTENVWVVGNTVIDALHIGLQLIDDKLERRYLDDFEFLDFSRRIVLLTVHRRESFGRPVEDIGGAIRDLCKRFADVQFVFPVHLNPNVKEPMHRLLGDCGNVYLVPPMDYPHLIWVMNRSHLVLTDSGGIQEEAPALGKPVLVMRDVTERVEGVEAGTAKLVGTKRDVIVAETSRLLTDPDAYLRMARAVNPYGDGTTSRQIRDIFREHV
jgi:UDP-N-acetylglucosamine 2-epimerase (non-hydrolysing)